MAAERAENGRCGPNSAIGLSERPERRERLDKLCRRADPAGSLSCQLAILVDGLGVSVDFLCCDLHLSASLDHHRQRFVVVAKSVSRTRLMRAQPRLSARRDDSRRCDSVEISPKCFDRRTVVDLSLVHLRVFATLDSTHHRVPRI